MKKKLTKLLLSTLFCTSSFIFTSLETRANLFNSILGNWCAVETNTAFFGKQLIQQNDPMQWCFEFLTDGNVILTSSIGDGIFPYKKLDKNRIVIYAAQTFLVTLDSENEQLSLWAPNQITGGKAEYIFKKKDEIQKFLKEHIKQGVEEKRPIKKQSMQYSKEDKIQAGILYKSGLKKSKKGNHTDAINDYNMSIKYFPNDWDVYWERGVSYSTLGDYQNAIKSLKLFIIKYSKNNPDDIKSTYSAYANICQFYNMLKEYENAIENCNTALELKPNFDGAFAKRGWANINLKKYDDAINDLTKAIEFARSNKFKSGIYNDRSLVYINLKNYKKAISDCNKAIALNSNNSLAYFRRAYLKSKIEDNSGAISDYNKAINLDPNDYAAYANRGWSKRNLGDIKGACLDWGKATSLGDIKSEKWVKEQC